jgi:hypothetical protein
MDIDDSSAMCSWDSPMDLDMDPWSERQASPVFAGMEVAQSPSQDRRVDTRESIEMADDREVRDMLAMRSPSCRTSEGSSSIDEEEVSQMLEPGKSAASKVSDMLAIRSSLCRTSEGSSSIDAEEVGQMLESGVSAASKVIGMHAISVSKFFIN